MYYNNKKLILSIFWVCAGIALIVISSRGIIDGTIWAGCGGSLCTVGVAQIIKNLKYQKDDNFREKVDIEFNDERNRYLRLKAWSWAGYGMVLILGVAVIVCMVIGNKEYLTIISGIECLMLILYWISYAICKNRC